MALYSLYLVIDMKQLRSKVLLLSFSGNLVYLFIFYIFYILETYRTPFQNDENSERSIYLVIYNNIFFYLTERSVYHLYSCKYFGKEVKGVKHYLVKSQAEDNKGNTQM